MAVTVAVTVTPSSSSSLLPQSHFELHALLVKSNQKCDAIDAELAGERRRAAVKDDHYRAQDEDASKLTAENRLLLDRVHQLGASEEAHKKQVMSPPPPDTHPRTHTTHTTHLPTSTPSRPPSRTTLTGPLCPPNVSPQIELLQNENVHQAARLQLLEQRKDLAKALTSLGPQLEALKGFTDTNQEMASAIKDLIPAIQSVPAAPAPLPKVV